MLSKLNTAPRSSRLLHSSASHSALQQKQLPSGANGRTHSPVRPRLDSKADGALESKQQRGIKRNELGVQLLSRKLHEQIFRNVSFPPPPPSYVRVAKEHLQTHGLDPSQGSVLSDIAFTLPPLQGRTLDQHFHRIGASAAEPWLALANTLARAELPPKPDHWHVQAGWTKYLYLADGSIYSTHVDQPEHDGRPEDMLVFDVETLPAHGPYAVMACAVSPHAWYSWLSPWLLGESADPQQLIALGAPSVPRVVVGHNVSYDRGRIREEYSIAPTRTRFVDTMALHVAVKGISSNQRPAWNKYRKSKDKERERREEAVDTVVELMRQAEERREVETDPAVRADLDRLLREMEESLPMLQAEEEVEPEEDLSAQRWEDLTSANSLADVAKLHCDITMDKETRDDFMKCSPAEIAENVQDYLNYCSNDVAVTHAVFSKTLPAFLAACPSPVSFAGILTMGSSLLTVNQEWEAYLVNAERTYKDLEDKVKARLLDLAHQAKELIVNEKWKDDVWLSQLDWTPKVVGKSRGILPHESTEVEVSDPSSVGLPDRDRQPLAVPEQIPAWYREFLTAGPLSSRAYSSAEKWHWIANGTITRLPTARDTKTATVLGPRHGIPAFKSGSLTSNDNDLAIAISSGAISPEILSRIVTLAKQTSEMNAEQAAQDAWLRQLDWTLVEARIGDAASEPQRKPARTHRAPAKAKPPPAKKDCAPGTLDLTVRNRFAPLLLRLSWQGWPLFHSREHGWTFRVSRAANFETRMTALSFGDAADNALQEAALSGGFVFYKLPHKDGEKANVGSPLGKTFMKFAQDGTLTSPGTEAQDALDMNAQCSYWISARDRVLKQMVVWQDRRVDIGVPPLADARKKWGIILPQVITMGTVTRRAIEKTWLTASNAKANRVGSELKAMVRAPDGYAIVGADVDSEELWISSVMGDAQFGLHGATAIGWMTLEGTKAAGTDLHSKTASILGISRDQAKVFNYSRIYGAGMRHAVLLLLQSNAGMLPEQAQKLAQNLYASTKGKNTHRGDLFGRKFWFGGTESFVFNKLEEIALSARPQTPALGCGVTSALSKEYLPAAFGADYMPSRINWVVQSSGVDYLHLLIVAMEHLISKYNIQARYLISVHDELRYLVKEEDRYPFFSAVDIDHVLRKEVDMPCVTPSQPVPILPGESLDIAKVLAKTNGGSLWPDGSPMLENDGKDCGGSLVGYREPDCLTHRADSAAWLRAQATMDLQEIQTLANQCTGPWAKGGAGGTKSKRPRIHGLNRLKKVRALGNGDGVDWANTVEQLLKSLDFRA
ncbi:gamma DNA-directed DNA polymerase [Amylocystis lapponica]|nr:gamma DNA-directed DNA polymerase [Amylocystis lapponica]